MRLAMVVMVIASVAWGKPLRDMDTYNPDLGVVWVSGEQLGNGGTGVRDLSPAEMHLDEGTPSVVGGVGPDGGAILRMDGDYAEKSVSNFRSSDTEAGFSVWVKSSTNSVLMATADEADDGSYVYVYFNLSGGISVVKRENSGITRGTDTVAGGWNDNAWHHVYIDVGGSVQIYIDGSQEAINSSAYGSNNGDWFSTVSNRDNFSLNRLHRLTVGGAQTDTDMAKSILYPQRFIGGFEGLNARIDRLYHEGRTSGY